MPETPLGWRSTTLGASGNLGSRRPTLFKGRRPYVATADLVGGQVRPSEIVSFAERPARADLELRTGDVLQAKMKATDKALLVDSDMDGWLASTGFAQFSPQAVGNDPEFFFHWVSSARFHYLKDALCVGSTQQAISDRELSAIRIVLPLLEEQGRIAEILDTIDEAIRRTEQVIAKLQQMKQGLLRDLLARGIDGRGDPRDPVKQPREFRETPIGRIPTEWDLRPLRGWVSKDAPITYGIVQAGPDVPGGVPYIRTGDMAGEALKLDGLPRTSNSIARSYARSTVRTGDIVYAIRATVGKALSVPRELDGANLTQGTARISPGPETGKRFLLWALRGWSVMRQVASVQKGTTYQEITLGQLREILVAAPRSRAEQDRIADTIDSIEQRLGEERRLGSKLREAKRGLMEDLLSGRVRVQSPEGVCA